MEKFGIFELLDTLSALTAASGAPAEGHGPSEAEGLKEPSRTPPAPQPAFETPQGGRAERDALAGFLAKHDEIAKRARR